MIKILILSVSHIIDDLVLRNSKKLPLRTAFFISEFWKLVVSLPNYPTISIPALRADPSMIFIAASISFALRSGILRSAIART